MQQTLYPNTPVETIVKQGSPDWHGFRSLGFGGSEANIIAGHSKYQNVVDLWEFKSGIREREDIVNDAMQHGIDTEPEARLRFEQATGLKMTPKCFEHHEFPFIRASLDGITDNNQIVLEIKCPTRLGIHMKTVRGTMPDYYYPQVQHQLFVTGAKSACFWSYMKTTGGFMLEVKPNESYLKELVRREIKLWECVQTRTMPSVADFPLMSSS